MPLRTACHTITWGWKPFEDHCRQMLAEIKEAGYEGVEFSPCHVDDPAEVRKAARGIGLEITGMSAGDPAKGIEFALSLGAAAYVVGGPTFDSLGRTGATEADYTKLSKELAALVDFGRKNQIAVTLHPHLGSIVLTEYDLDRILGAVGGLKFCPDIAHLKAGGTDPVRAIKKYKDRLWGAHLKDLCGDRFVELGKGNSGIDFREVIKALEGSVYEGWVTVELDSTKSTPFQSAKTNRDYLRIIGC